MTTQIAREETRCRHMGYFFRLAAKVILYASSHTQDDTYRGLYYNSRGALAGTRNSSMRPLHEGSISPRSYILLHTLKPSVKLTNAQISTLYLIQQFIKYGVANITPRQFHHIRLIFCGTIVCVGSEM